MRQGCVLSPLLFNAYMDKIVRDAAAAYEGGLQVEYTTSGGLFLTYRDKTPDNTCVPNIQYADDLIVCAESRGDLQSMLLVLNTSCTKWGMKINGEKTKVLSIGEAGDDHLPITLNGQILEAVDSFSYLGSEVHKMGKVEKEVGVRLEKAATVYHMWRRKVFCSRILTKDTKMRAFRLMVMSETWAVTQHDIRRFKTFQMRCLRNILGLTLLDRRRNIDILEETGELPIEHQLRKKRLQWFGHLSRMPDHRIAKQLLRCRPR